MGQFLNKEELDDLENTLLQSKNIHEYCKLYNNTNIIINKYNKIVVLLYNLQYSRIL